jgi:HEAT repeat protein
MFGSGFRKQIAKLARDYPSGTPAQRRAAAAELAGLCIIADEPDEAIPLLEAMLSDADAEVAAHASNGFMACHELSVPPLRRLIEHPRADVRERACHALGSLHDHVDRSEAVPALLAALVDPAPGVRGRAAFALGQIPDTSRHTVDALAMLTRDVDANVRSWALHALGRIGRHEAGRRAVGAHRTLFLEALSDADDDVRWSACYALQTSELRGTMAFRMLLERLRLETVTRVRQEISGTLFPLARDEDVAAYLPMLLEIAQEQPEARSTIFSLCSELGSRASALLPLIRESLTLDNGLSGITALRAITGSDAEVIPALEHVLEHGDFQQRFRAANELLRITGRFDRIIPMLERALEESPDEPGMFIQEIGRPLAVMAPALARAIEREFAEPDWDVMWNLACAMAALESSAPESVAALRKALTHESDRVQSAAIEGLMHAGPAARDALPELRKFAAGKGALAKAARAAIHAIGQPTN